MPLTTIMLCYYLQSEYSKNLPLFLWIKEGAHLRGHKCRYHDTFLRYPSSGLLKVKRFESQIISKYLGGRKSKSLNRIAKIS